MSKQLPSTKQLLSTRKLPSTKQLPPTKQLSSTKQLPSTKQLLSTRKLPSTKQLPPISKIIYFKIYEDEEEIDEEEIDEEEMDEEKEKEHLYKLFPELLGLYNTETFPASMLADYNYFYEYDIHQTKAILNMLNTGIVTDNQLKADFRNTILESYDCGGAGVYLNIELIPITDLDIVTLDKQKVLNRTDWDKFLSGSIHKTVNRSMNNFDYAIWRWGKFYVLFSGYVDSIG